MTRSNKSRFFILPLYVATLVTFLLSSPYAWPQNKDTAVTTWSSLEANIAKIDRQQLITIVKNAEKKIRAVLPDDGLVLSPKETKLFRDFKAKFHGKKTPAEKLAYITEFTKTLGDDLDMDGDYSVPLRVIIYPDPMLRNQRVTHILGKKLDLFNHWPQTTWSTDIRDLNKYDELCQRSMRSDSTTFCTDYYCCNITLDDDRFFPDATFSPAIVAWSTATEAQILFKVGKWLQFYAITDQHDARLVEALQNDGVNALSEEGFSFAAFFLDLDLHLERLHLSDNPTDEELAAATESLFAIVNMAHELNKLSSRAENEGALRTILETAFTALENDNLKDYLESCVSSVIWVHFLDAVAEISYDLKSRENDLEDYYLFIGRFYNQGRLLRTLSDLYGGNPVDGTPYPQPTIMIIPLGIAPTTPISNQSK